MVLQLIPFHPVIQQRHLLAQSFFGKNIKMFRYGISGYVVATGTGFFRMYNDRHWLTDVAAGAGIGICTKTAWLYPKMQLLFKRNKTSVMIAPFITEKKGIGLVGRF
jgi:membrane-associated phospholipid phosphatase